MAGSNAVAAGTRAHRGWRPGDWRWAAPVGLLAACGLCCALPVLPLLSALGGGAAGFALLGMGQASAGAPAAAGARWPGAAVAVLVGGALLVVAAAVWVLRARRQAARRPAGPTTAGCGGSACGCAATGAAADEQAAGGS